MCDTPLSIARVGLWFFYALDIFSYTVAFFYHWILFGRDGETRDVVDASFYTLILIGFWFVGYWSTKKRDYFGNVSDWATETEIRAMYFVCLPGGMLTRNCSSNEEIKNFAAPFECYFWWIYTIYNCTFSILAILINLWVSVAFALFLMIMLGLYLWAYYTLLQYKKPGQAIEQQIEDPNISAADQRAIVYGNENANQSGTGSQAPQPTYTDAPPNYIQSSENANLVTGSKLDFAPIQIDDDKGTDTSVGYDNQGIIAPSNTSVEK